MAFNELSTVITEAIQADLFAEVDTHLTTEVPPRVDTAVTAEDIPGQVSTAIAAQNGKVVIGSGSPQSVVTAVVGTLYTDTAATLGVSIWRKATGTGNTGWKVLEADTGWRDCRSLLANGWTASDLQLRRVNGRVAMRVGGLVGTSATLGTVASGLPSGFEPDSSQTITAIIRSSNSTVFIISSGAGVISAITGQSSHGLSTEIEYTAPSWWPATLPGTAA